MTARWLLPAVLCLAALGCRHTGEATAQEPTPTIAGDEIVFQAASRQLAALTVEPARPSLPAAMRFSGRLAWDESVTVRVFPEFSGRVLSIAAEVGQVVSRGDLLARIASPDFGLAQADAHKASGDFILAERTLRRTRELFLHGASAQKDVDAAEADYARTKAEKQRAESRLALYSGTERSIDHIYGLRSPLAGVVAEKNLNPGQEVRADQMLANAPQYFAPLFVVTDPTRLWVVLDVGEGDLGKFRRGQTLQVRSQGAPERTFEAVVDWISDFVDPSTRTFRVRGTLNNAQRLLKDETFVSVTVASEAGAGIDVASSAVFLEGSKFFVYRENGPGRYQRREVTVGPERDGRILVVAGLQSGDPVVTHGCMLLEQLIQSGG